jgi:hypothetical protein
VAEGQDKLSYKEQDVAAILSKLGIEGMVLLELVKS